MNQYSRTSSPSSRMLRLWRILLMTLISFALITGVFMHTSQTAYAATPLEVDDVMLLYAYIGSGNTCGMANENDEYVKIEGANGATDWRLSSGKTELTIADPLTFNNCRVWDQITNLNDAYIRTCTAVEKYGLINTVQYQNCYALSQKAALVYAVYGGNQELFKEAMETLLKSSGNSITINLATGSYTATNNSYSSKLKSAINDINASWVEQAAKDTFDRIYDMSEWNPNEGVAAEALSKVYNVINVLFYAVSNLLIWGFFLQSVYDCAYILFEPVRPFIGPREGSSGGGILNNGGDGKGSLLSRINLPICSAAAAECVNGGGGGLGGNGGAAVSGAKALGVYFLRRAPLLICIAVYIILTVLGYWRLLISWAAGFVIRAFNFLFSFGG